MTLITKGKPLFRLPLILVSPQIIQTDEGTNLVNENEMALNPHEKLPMQKILMGTQYLEMAQTTFVPVSQNESLPPILESQLFLNPWSWAPNHHPPAVL